MRSYSGTSYTETFETLDVVFDLLGFLQRVNKRLRESHLYKSTGRNSKYETFQFANPYFPPVSHINTPAVVIRCIAIEIAWNNLSKASPRVSIRQAGKTTEIQIDQVMRKRKLRE